MYLPGIHPFFWDMMLRHSHCIYLPMLCGHISKKHLYGFNITNTLARVSFDGNLFFLSVLFNDAVNS
jgi:hypothetical protein